MFTPGHAPGHLCFVDAAARAIVAGDMVASVGTIIIEPDDDGDMRLYLESLRRLRGEVDGGATCLLPAHGPPITDGGARLDFYVAHRLEREARVAAALGDAPRDDRGAGAAGVSRRAGGALPAGGAFALGAPAEVGVRRARAPSRRRPLEPSMKIEAKSAKEYVAAIPAERRPHVEKLRALVKAAVPAATEGIQWGMIGYTIGGRPFVGDRVAEELPQPLLDGPVHAAGAARRSTRRRWPS